MKSYWRLLILLSAIFFSVARAESRRSATTRSKGEYLRCRAQILDDYTDISEDEIQESCGRHLILREGNQLEFSLLKKYVKKPYVAFLACANSEIEFRWLSSGGKPIDPRKVDLACAGLLDTCEALIRER